ncbi:putative DNA helicase required for mitotic chromosome segregation CHL1 [Galdieria sulphuraria]|uniref:DNA 5'-3' helicase FANCJ n=1 Tax=Galdieria sulphuraria TaxID=130081 RepID=M2Y0C2_GALSU|nr:putative DNA helicase required for mitotic chromosome segregation CHL1 [Galdieria sulphuraria]EME29284.1 putative DNA helicase required for mitotic chromosome segregation CHL1 [Galdieria sulphuraria]|eukprot:XP_005705804.1 putative DNA helicase required for mitotic chromosome segregation CHL1 [Galdieria sulphuraria]
MPFQVYGTEIEFPYEPYPVQFVFMEKILRACENSQNALLESPTGTGKSLALLCAVLAWQKKTKNKMQLERIEKENIGKQRFDAAVAKYRHGRGKEPLADTFQDNQTNRHMEKRDLDNCLEEKSISSDDDFQQGIGTNQTIDSDSDDWITHDEDNNLDSDKEIIPPKIFFATRTHTQIDQVVQELRRTSYRPKMDILGSRDRYCIHNKVIRSQNRNEECKKLLEERSCSYAFGVEKVHNIKELSENHIHQVWDIEDLVRIGKRHNLCPYFSSQELMKTAELIFCPYSYLLDPVVRNAMQVELSNSIVILDEAHNIEDVCREAASCEVFIEELEQVRTELETLDMNQNTSMGRHLSLVNSFVSGVISWCHEQDAHQKFVVDKSDFEKETFSCTGKLLLDALECCGVTKTIYSEIRRSVSRITNTELFLSEHLDETSTKKKRVGLPEWASITLERLMCPLEFIFNSSVDRSDDFLLVLMKTRKGTMWSFKLCLWCFNPAVSFSYLQSHSRCIVLSSGTLTPMDSFSSELGIHFDIMNSLPHVIDVKNQVCAIASSCGPNSVDYDSTFAASSSIAYHDCLGQSILEYCRVIPDGVICFFPSYRLLESVVRRWRQSGYWKELESCKQVFIEPCQNDRVYFDNILLSYYHAIHKKQGALFLAVCRGKVSEGIDFKDEYARGVIIVGLPYPNLRDLQVIQKKEYNDRYSASRKLLNGQRWYALQAFRSLNQAIGRCIRHKNDYGVIVLLDKRYTRHETLRNLPKWLAHQIRIATYHEVAISMISHFIPQVEARVVPLKRVIGTRRTLETRMDLLGTTGSREGNRGGRDQFSWEKVKEDKYRENYLGHSLHAPVGLSSKKKDSQWFIKPPKRQNGGNEELKKIQRQEAIMMRASLQGIPVQDAISLALEQSNQVEEKNSEVTKDKSERPLSPQNESRDKNRVENDRLDDSHQDIHRRHGAYHHHTQSRSKERHRHRSKGRSSKDRRRRRRYS